MKADVVIEATAISQKHALLAVNNGKIILKDIGSKNGVYINTLENRLDENIEISIEESMTFYLSEFKCRVRLIH